MVAEVFDKEVSAVSVVSEWINVPYVFIERLCAARQTNNRLEKITINFN